MQPWVGKAERIPEPEHCRCCHQLHLQHQLHYCSSLGRGDALPVGPAAAQALHGLAAKRLAATVCILCVPPQGSYAGSAVAAALPCVYQTCQQNKSVSSLRTARPAAERASVRGTVAATLPCTNLQYTKLVDWVRLPWQCPFAEAAVAIALPHTFRQTEAFASMQQKMLLQSTGRT